MSDEIDSVIVIYLRLFIFLTMFTYSSVLHFSSLRLKRMLIFMGRW